MAKRSYSDEEKASALAALAAISGNVKQTASQTGVPRATLQRWASGELRPPPPAVAGRLAGSRPRPVAADRPGDGSAGQPDQLDLAAHLADDHGAVGEDGRLVAA